VDTLRFFPPPPHDHHHHGTLSIFPISPSNRSVMHASTAAAAAAAGEAQLPYLVSFSNGTGGKVLPPARRLPIVFSTQV